MTFGLMLLIVYRAMALAVALMMIWVMFRQRDWREQVFAAIVLVPFALRAAGVK